MRTVTFLKICLVAWLVCPITRADETTTNSTLAEPFHIPEPASMAGAVYETGSNHKKLLFHFTRTETQSGATLQVDRQFTLPDGTLAATEHVTYVSGQMASYQNRELQSGAWGDIFIKPDARDPSRQKITINHGHDGDTKKPGTTDDLAKDTLVDDSLYPFLLLHWDDLAAGNTVKFHMASLEQEKSYAFKLYKAGETTCNGQPAVTIRMEASNLIVGSFFSPINFILEKAAPHRIFEYIGRTTPKIKHGRKWKPLDADTVFDWN
jgi:hypothetical protein